MTKVGIILVEVHLHTKIVVQEITIIHFKYYFKFGYAILDDVIIIPYDQNIIHINYNKDQLLSLIEHI